MTLNQQCAIMGKELLKEEKTEVTQYLWPQLFWDWGKIAKNSLGYTVCLYHKASKRKTKKL